MNDKKKQDTDWKARVHELVWNDMLLTHCHKWVSESKLDPIDALEHVVSNGVSCKARYVAGYDCYTISLSYPKAHKDHSGLTHWFYWNNLEEGLKIAAWLHDDFLVDYKVGKGLNRQIDW